MNRVCLAAYTAPSNPYPEYMSIYQTGAKVTITVREANQPDVVGGGRTVDITMPVDEFRTMLADAAARIVPDGT